jgi:drug/metabolite transporter (DMT)-like permease
MVGVKYLDVAIANTFNSTEPLFALPLAVIFLKERVTVLMVIGSLITICGIILLTGGWWPV